MLRILRRLLYPFSLLFGAVVCLRNHWFKNRGWKSPVPAIVVGNLTTGGTGKTPHSLLVAEILLQHGKRPVMLSRGYGRKTKGFYEVETRSLASRVGDEPLMMKRRFPELRVFVSESRVDGIRKIWHDGNTDNGIDCVVLDDAFQHRSLKPDFALALITYKSLNEPWLLLPAGDAREPLSALRRADGVIVTKCPDEISELEKTSIRERIKKYTDVPVYYSTYRYLGLVNMQAKPIVPDAKKDRCLLLTGIADAKPLEDWLKMHFTKVSQMIFADHHPFTKTELNKALQNAGDGFIVLTEKDIVRIGEVWPDFLEKENVLLASVAPYLGDFQKEFEQLVLSFVQK